MDKNSLTTENAQGGAHFRLSRVPFGYQYRYFLKVKGYNVRISKDLYRQLKRIIEDD